MFKAHDSQVLTHSRKAWLPQSISARITLAVVAGTFLMALAASVLVLLMTETVWAGLPQVGAIFGAAVFATALIIGSLRYILAPIQELQQALEHYQDHGVSSTLSGTTKSRGDLLALVEELLARIQTELNHSRTAADTDPLTGLLNRRGFDRHRAQGDTGSIIFIDLDDFKKVNDALGHDAGDVVLSQTADLLRSVLREGELVARFGGEEFVVYLPGIDLATAGLVAERIRGSAEHGLTTELGEVTVSAGVAQQRPGERFSDALIRADRAAYQAKHAGRNRVHVADGSAPLKMAPLHSATAAE